MDIERLRALEKNWREMANDRANAEWVTLVNCSNELRDLIAELGQEVGAVEPVAFAVELPDGSIGKLGWMDYGSFDLCTGVSELREGCRYVFAYRTSPAHTSEARELTDAMVEAALDAQPFTADNVSHRVWQLVSQALTDEERRTMMRAALDAAMRQEGGSDA